MIKRKTIKTIILIFMFLLTGICISTTVMAGGATGCLAIEAGDINKVEWLISPTNDTYEYKSGEGVDSYIDHISSLLWGGGFGWYYSGKVDYKEFDSNILPKDIQSKYRSISSWKANGYIRVESEGPKSEYGFSTRKFGLIDMTGKEIIPPIYDDLGMFFSEGLIFAKLEGKGGFLDVNNNWVIGPYEEWSNQYGGGRPFINGIAIIDRNDGTIIIIDKNENIVASEIFKVGTISLPDAAGGFESWWQSEDGNSIGIIVEVKGVGYGIMKPPSVSATKNQEVQTQSTDLIAKPTASTVIVDGKNVSFESYNINDSNYFKLRDLAHALNGSAKQFDVGWDDTKKSILLTSGKSYASLGSEMADKGIGSKTAISTNSKIYVDGKEVSLIAYNINGNNYFKLRDIGQVFNFRIGWDSVTNTITVDTSKRYEP